MNIYIPLGIFLLIVTFVFRNNIKQSQKFFLISFLILFVFSALRYDFGPDYDSYADNFSMLKSLGLKGFLEYNQHSEEGFAFFFSLFDSYFIFIIVQSFIWLSVFFLFFKNNVPAQYYYIVILMMFFNVNFNLMNYTAIRSSLASCFFFAGLSFLISTEEGTAIGQHKGQLRFFKKWNWILYLLFVYVGSLFHTSIIVFVIFPFITNGKNISKSSSQMLLGVGIVLAILSVMFRTTFTLALTLWIIDLFPSSFERYTDYLDMLNTAGGGFGALVFNVTKILIAYPILHALTVEKESRHIRLMKFSIIFLYTFLLINENLLTRFTMCFYPIIIVALLRSLKYASNVQRQLALLSIIFLSVFQFYNSINISYYSSFLEYHTIFSAPKWL